MMLRSRWPRKHLQEFLNGAGRMRSAPSAPPCTGLAASRKRSAASTRESAGRTDRACHRTGPSWPWPTAVSGIRPRPDGGSTGFALTGLAWKALTGAIPNLSCLVGRKAVTGTILSFGCFAGRPSRLSWIRRSRPTPLHREFVLRPMIDTANGPSHEESDLLRRAAGGDQEALRAVFERYRDRLKRMVHLRLSR